MLPAISDRIRWMATTSSATCQPSSSDPHWIAIPWARAPLCGGEIQWLWFGSEFYGFQLSLFYMTAVANFPFAPFGFYSRGHLRKYTISHFNLLLLQLLRTSLDSLPLRSSLRVTRCSFLVTDAGNHRSLNGPSSMESLLLPGFSIWNMVSVTAWRFCDDTTSTSGKPWEFHNDTTFFFLVWNFWYGVGFVW